MTASFCWFCKKHLMITGVVAAIAASSFAAGLGYAAQPHMQAALSGLQTARAELQVATHDKGGHRANALKLVNEAIGEVQAGIAAGS